MSLTTGTFLSCTSVPTSAVTATVTETVTFTTEYCVTLPAACPTSQWMATYTINEVCTGDKNAWTTPAIPPNFVVTRVACTEGCSEPTVTVTCPVETASQTGSVVIKAENGMTASGVSPNPTGAAGAAGSDNGAGNGADNGGSSATGSNGGDNSGAGSNSGSGSTGDNGATGTSSGDNSGTAVATAGAPTLKQSLSFVLPLAAFALGMIAL